MRPHWWPVGAHLRYQRPAVGTLVAWDFGVWRVVAVTDVEQVDFTDRERDGLAVYTSPGLRERYAPYHVVLRPVGVTGDDPRARDEDQHLRASGHASWPVYDDEHYPVCAQCGGPVPCRWTEAQRAGENALKRMSRYEMAGVCPACEEPVTKRQKSLTWPDNVELPGGPPVTFHLRAKCWGTAQDYERRWVAEAPEQRRAVLSCRGHVITHGDGTYECSEMVECPGPQAGHRAYSTCRPVNATIYRGPRNGGCTDPACQAVKQFGCYPPPNAVRRSL